MGYFFISYDKRNYHYAYSLARFLRSQGFDLWLKTDLGYGLAWWNSIVEGLQDCSAVILLMSPSAETSEWVHKEVLLALALEKPVIPVLLDGLTWDLFKFLQHWDQRSASMPDDNLLRKLNELVPIQAGAGANRNTYRETYDAQLVSEELFWQNRSGVEAIIYWGQLCSTQMSIDEYRRRYFSEVEKNICFNYCLRIYQNLQDSAENIPPHQTLDYLESLWRLYPDYDPANLAERAYLKINRGNPQRATVLDILPQPFEWITIPAGKVKIRDQYFALSSNIYTSSETRFEYDIPEFQIAKYPITNAQYQVFVEAEDGFRDFQWWNFSQMAFQSRHDFERYFGKGGQPVRPMGNDLPVTNVSAYDAIAFCRWLGMRTEQSITLPTTYQWQRAGQGDDDRRFPWGDEVDLTRYNYSVVDLLTPFVLTAVTQFPNGASPYGVVDLLGNAKEWCLNPKRQSDKDGYQGRVFYRGMGRYSAKYPNQTSDLNSLEQSVIYHFNVGQGFRICIAPKTNMAFLE
jgi:formylglycine-generating enzyme required for sulfatase activity